MPGVIFMIHQALQKQKQTKKAKSPQMFVFLQVVIIFFIVFLSLVLRQVVAPSSFHHQHNYSLKHQHSFHVVQHQERAVPSRVLQIMHLFSIKYAAINAPAVIWDSFAMFLFLVHHVILIF